jgi:hypothetical protein
MTELILQVEKADDNDPCRSESQELVEREFHQVHGCHPTIPALTIAPNSAFCTGVVVCKPT